MDFDYNEEQEAVRQLAERICTEVSTHERLKQVEADAGDVGPFDAVLWSALADAGLLGIGLPDDVGGAGLDFVAVCLVVEAAGRTAAAVPVVETLVAGAGTIDRFGTAEQRRRWLPGVARGETVVAAALSELVGSMVVPALSAPATTATPSGPGSWRLDGTKACVASGLRADLVLVPATLAGSGDGPDRTGVFVVDAAAEGVALTPQGTTTGRPEAMMRLDGVEVDEPALLGGRSADGAPVMTYLVEHTTAALCVLEAGACRAALELTGEYTKTREQFGKPIATFQAVGQRAADAYVDAEAIRLTAWQAAWRIGMDLPAADATAVAKFWAADGGQRVVHAAVHLHGGVGVDRDYPLHRYFLMTKHIELTLGGATDHLLQLGATLAAEPV